MTVKPFVFISEPFEWLCVPWARAVVGRDQRNVPCFVHNRRCSQNDSVTIFQSKTFLSSINQGQHMILTFMITVYLRVTKVNEFSDIYVINLFLSDEQLPTRAYRVQVSVHDKRQQRKGLGVPARLLLRFISASFVEINVLIEFIYSVSYKINCFCLIVSFVSLKPLNADEGIVSQQTTLTRTRCSLRLAIRVRISFIRR